MTKDFNYFGHFQMEKNLAAGKKEMADMYEKQMNGLRDQITAMQNRPVEIHHHHHESGGGCVIS